MEAHSVRLRSTYKLTFRLHSWKKSRVSVQQGLPPPVHTHLDAMPFLWGITEMSSGRAVHVHIQGKELELHAGGEGPPVLHGWKVKVP